eukprot:5051511-Amphidinium_carterae.1
MIIASKSGSNFRQCNKVLKQRSHTLSLQTSYSWCSFKSRNYAHALRVGLHCGGKLSLLCTEENAAAEVKAKLNEAVMGSMREKGNEA